jgi:aryl-alcohol dehydrogenase-like predicted oxidoreductase
MDRRRLGSNGPEAGRIGLGCMGMSVSYGEPDDAESTATIQRALDIGVDLIVTSDAYGKGVNEELVGRAIKGRRKQVVLGTKFGNLAMAGGQGVDGRPAYAMAACDASLARLGVDEIDLYGLHRVDPKVPIEDTVGAMSRLVEQGKVRHLVLSEAGPETLRRACRVHPIAVLETEYSLWSRNAEKDVLPACRELGVAFMAYAPLGRGFLSGAIKTLDALLPKDRRRDHPRFKPENIAKNVELLRPIEAIAAAHRCTTAQVAIAWVLAQGQDIVPIPGTKRRKYLDDNAGAIDVTLSADDIARLSAAFPPDVAAGTRYPEKQLGGLGI